MDLDSRVENISLWYKVEPQIYVGLSNDTESCTEVATCLKFSNETWRFKEPMENKSSLCFESSYFSTISSFGSYLTEAWVSEQKAVELMKEIYRVLNHNGVFYGIIPDGRLIFCPDANHDQIIFGSKDMVHTPPNGQTNYIIYKSVFAKVAQRCGFVNVEISMLPDTKFFSFVMTKT